MVLAVLVQIMALQTSPAQAAPGDVVGTVTEIGAEIQHYDFNGADGAVPIDPAGITYLSHKDKLLISDSEIEEESFYAGVNLWEINRNASGLIGTGQAEPLTPTDQEPTGLAYNAQNHHIYLPRDNDPKRIREIDPGPDDLYGTGDDTTYTWDYTPFTQFGDPSDPEDVAWDSKDKILWVANGAQGTLIPVSLGPDGLISGADTMPGTPLDVSAWVPDTEGIEYRASSDTLLLTQYANPQTIVEITKDGRLVRKIDIDHIVSLHPTDLAIAPASTGNGTDLFVVDRGLDNNESNAQDGQMFEIDALFTNLSPFVDAGPNETIPGNSLTLTGDAYDDGQPTPTSMSLTWSKVSGPGTANFASPHNLTTDVTFSASGTYVLRLTATDTVYANDDTVTVTVGGASGNGTFIDDDGSTFESDIEWIAAEGITKGCNPPVNDRYCPDDFVTRGQMAAFLVRAMGYTDNGGGDLFIDDNASIFENDIDRLATAGVTKGCNPPTNSKYCPDDFVTRGQMAAFLVRAMGYTDNGGGDLFIDDNASVFENDIDRLATAGVTKGCNPPTNNKYCPDDFVTRGQMAAFLHRALG